VSLREVLSRGEQGNPASQVRRGLWRARVLRVDDPENRGRVQVRVQHLHPPSEPRATRTEGEVPLQGIGGGIADGFCPWAEPAFAFGGNPQEGSVFVPSVGSTVWVAFEAGFTGKPVWLGGFFATGELPFEVTDPSAIRLIRTPGGNVLLFDDAQKKLYLGSPAATGSEPRIRMLEINDTTGELRLLNGDPGVGTQITLRPNALELRAGENTLVLDGSGNITLNNAGNAVETIEGSSTKISTGPQTIGSGANTLTIDPAGNVTITALGVVTLGIGASLGVMLESFIALYNGHTHGGGAAPDVPSQAVAGVHSSLTVRAKA
jgi:hypothetical protein